MSVRGLELPATVLIGAAHAALQGRAVVVSTPTHPGAIGLNLDALGTDWMVFYGGIRWLLEGHLGTLFDGERFTAYLNSAFAGWLSQPTPVAGAPFTTDHPRPIPKLAWAWMR